MISMMKNRIIVVAFFFLIAFSFLGLNYGFSLYILLCVVNGYISIKNFFSFPDEKYTLHKLVNLFILVFFIAANALQFVHNAQIISVSTISFSYYEYLFFQLIVLLILILYNYSYIYFRSKIHIKGYHEVKTTVKIKPLLVLSIISFTFVIITHIQNPISLLVRGGGEDFGVGGYDVGISFGGPMQLIIDKFVRPIPLCCYIIAKLTNIDKKYRKFLFIIMSLSIFPTSLARNATAMYWLSVLLLNVKVFEKRGVFVITMLLGIFIIFPVIDSFRHFSGSINFSNIGLDYLVTMHFDSSQMFMAIIQQYYVTYGLQLLGVLFFFVPRSIWPSKPIGSGHTFAIDNGALFANVSMPYFGEGFINFGYIGIIIFTLFLSYITVKCDKIYWNTKQYLFSGYYYLLLGAIFFILRGDLLSSFAYTTGGILSYSFVKRVVIK